MNALPIVHAAARWLSPLRGRALTFTASTFALQCRPPFFWGLHQSYVIAGAHITLGALLNLIGLPVLIAADRHGYRSDKLSLGTLLWALSCVISAFWILSAWDALAAL